MHVKVSGVWTGHLHVKVSGGEAWSSVFLVSKMSAVGRILVSSEE